VVLFAGLLLAVVGNPLEYFGRADPPALPGGAQRWLPAPIAPLAVPAGMPAAAAPPLVLGSFSILIGTYDSARQVALVERALRLQKHPIYVVDVLMAPGDRQRRVLLGRYASREEAERVRDSLGPVLNSSRVIPGEMERFRVIP
jgi:cell division septation protein DedD